MLHPSFFESIMWSFKNVLRTPYSSTPYSAYDFCRKVYTPSKNVKIRFIVPINLIFSKTVSSLFELNIINTYSKFWKTETANFTPSYLFFLKFWENGVRSTEYGVRIFQSLGV